MKAHTDEQFREFLSQLKETNRTLDFYCDFDKIGRNVADIEISLNTLNYLLGKADLQKAVEELWNRDPKVFEVMDILIATRKQSKELYLNDKGELERVHQLFSSVEGIMEFFTKTGLDKVIQDRKVKSLVDYVFGVETGLDTNSRKNRSGSITEKWVAHFFSEARLDFEQQVSSNEFPLIAEALGVDKKKFDFVVTTKKKTYLVEVNFYSGGGSKLNETARSYTDIAPKINAVKGYEFVWITDGLGWMSAKNKLEEAFAAILSIYNFVTINQFTARCQAE